MARSTGSRIAIGAAIVVAVLVLVAIGGLFALQHEVKNQIVDVLGPLGSAERIDVGFRSIELTNVRLKAPPDWPAPDALRAAHITITPDRRALLARRVHIRDVTVSDFDLTVLRRASGSIQLLPNLRQSVSSGGGTSSGGSGAPPAEKLVDHIAFQNGTFEFFDSSVSNPPYRVTVSDANATVDNLRLPALTEPTQLSVTGTIRGPSHAGHLAFGGWIKIASRDSQTTTTLRGIDVTTLDPYLLKKAGAKAQITGGTIDLDLQSTVQDYHLHAPGTLTLHQLQIAEPSGNPLDTFMAIPTRAAIAALKTHNGDLTLHFTLEGNLRDPKFQLNERLMTEIRTGFAKALGVSAEGVAKGAGETAKGLGDALRNLLGQ